MADVPNGRKSPETQETSEKTPTRPGYKGNGRLRVGNPGNKGGGRTPDDFKQWMQSFANSRDAERGLKEILKKGAEHPLFLGALKHVTEQGYGKPKEDKQHSGELTVRIVREARAIER